MSNIVEIELGDNKNSSFLFQPADEVLRGRRSRSNDTFNLTSPEYKSIPDLPGICIVVDLDERIVGYYDPLTQPKHKSALDKMDNYAKNVMRAKCYDGAPGKCWRKASDVTLNTWLWAMKCYVDQNFATLVRGSFPSIEGEAVVNRYDWSKGGSNRVKQVNSDDLELAMLDESKPEEWAGLAA